MNPKAMRKQNGRRSLLVVVLLLALLAAGVGLALLLEGPAAQPAIKGEAAQPASQEPAQLAPEPEQDTGPALVPQTMTWTEQEGLQLRLEVSVPEDWSYEGQENGSGDQDFVNAGGQKIAGSFGILRLLEEGETLEELDNPAQIPSREIECSLITVDGRDYLLEKANLSSRDRPDLYAYCYCFVQDGALLNFYFYNDGDAPEALPVYEAVLASIQATITQ